MKKFTCCSRGREISFDLNEQERIITYDGLGTCISKSYENENCLMKEGDLSNCIDDDDDKSSCSSSKDVFESFYSHCSVSEKDEDTCDGWDVAEKPVIVTHHTDVGTMKEKYSMLLLGEDNSGGSKGIASALALSNAITRLASNVFGELWKLEPLTAEKKKKWIKEMDWLLSPTNYMVELIPTKQNGENGRILEIMTPTARSDIHMNLPALQKLDSMLIGVLDSMVNTEFSYTEDATLKSDKQLGKWWFPSPKVPAIGLSESARKKLLFKRKIVYQVFKAAKAINESVLLDMPLPKIIKDAISKSGRSNLGEELYKVISSSVELNDALNTIFHINCESIALEAANKLEAAIVAWKEKTSQLGNRSPSRLSWSFMKDPISENDKMETLLRRADAVLRGLKSRYPNLPHTFLDSSKIQYGKDVGHSILEAYSRALANLAYSIVSRIGEVLQEDALSNSSSPLLMKPGKNSDSPGYSREAFLPSKTDSDTSTCASSDAECFSNEGMGSSVNSSSRVWCVGREAYGGASPTS